MLVGFFTSTAVILGFAGAGYVLGYFRESFFVRHRKVLSGFGFAVLCCLVWTMGFRLGSDPDLSSTMVRMGLGAVLIAVLTVVFSFVVVRIYSVLHHGKPADSGSAGPGETGWPGEETDAPAVAAWKTRLALFKDPAILLVIMAIGVVCGVVLQGKWVPADLSTWVLWLLLLVSGIGMALDGRESLKAIWHRDTLLVPLLTAAASLAAGAVAGLILGLGAFKGMCAAGGFGWYSLSGILITDLGNPFLGNTAFLSNLFRESISLLFIPLLGRLKMGREAVAIAGATSMDVTLPMIGRYAGPRWLGLSMAHGVFLSLLVPVIVPLLYAL